MLQPSFINNVYLVEKLLAFKKYKIRQSESEIFSVTNPN